MNYYTDENIEMVKNHFNVDDMLNNLVKHGLIEELTGNYSEDITDMCNNCTLMLGKHLQTYISADNIIVVEGVFNMMGNHTWIVIDDIIFDLSLAQFIPDAPKFSVLKENKYYHPINRSSFKEWLKTI
mgnify:CR=1 FL=1